jgi:hypothetical protein
VLELVALVLVSYGAFRFARALLAPVSVEVGPAAAVVSGRLLLDALPLMLPDALSERPLVLPAVEGPAASPPAPDFPCTVGLFGTPAEGSVLLWLAPLCAEAMPIVPKTAKSAATVYFVAFMLRFS